MIKSFEELYVKSLLIKKRKASYLHSRRSFNKIQIYLCIYNLFVYLKYILLFALLYLFLSTTTLVFSHFHARVLRIKTYKICTVIFLFKKIFAHTIIQMFVLKTHKSLLSIYYNTVYLYYFL